MGRIYRKQSLLMFFAVCRNTASQVKRKPNDCEKARMWEGSDVEAHVETDPVRTLGV